MKIINTLEGDHESDEEFLKINPTGTIPTLKENHYIILGSGDMTIINYICKTHHLCAKLYPRDKVDTIKRYFNFFQTQMRPQTRKLI